MKGVLSYPGLLRQVKQRVALAQQKAIYAANEELLRMYWDLGQILYKAQHAEGWGKGTLARLSVDMKNEYPEEKGFSERNLRCMIDFYLEYNQDLNAVKSSHHSFLQPAVAELHNDTDKLHKNSIVQPPVAELQDNAKGTNCLHENTITKPPVAQLPEKLHVTGTCPLTVRL